MDGILAQLVILSHHLGDPSRDYVKLSQGNVSARADEKSFWVKASGTELRTAGPESFVRVDFGRVMSILDEGDLSEEEVRQHLADATLDPQPAPASSPVLTPSIETIAHAICLELEGVDFVGHTHPPVVNVLTFSSGFLTVAEELELLNENGTGGPPLFVPHADPGLPLARLLIIHLNSYQDEYTRQPEIILLQNHGLIVTGSTAEDVENLTAQAVKMVSILHL